MATPWNSTWSRATKTRRCGFRGRVYRVQDYSGPAARGRLYNELAEREYTVVGILCSNEAIMTKWKWMLAARLPAKIFVINEFAGFLFARLRPLAEHRWNSLRVRLGLSGSAIAPALGRLLLFPFSLAFLLLFAAVVHTRRRIRLIMKAVFIEQPGDAERSALRRFPQARTRRRPGAGEARRRGREFYRHLSAHRPLQDSVARRARHGRRRHRRSPWRRRQWIAGWAIPSPGPWRAAATPNTPPCPAQFLVKVPAGLDLRQAAAAMLQGMTAHYLTHSTFPIEPGHTALVHAAAGGTGRLISQMVKLRGGRVIGTAGTREKAEVARAAGADDVILYREQDVVAEVKRLTDGKGVDVVYDGVGEATFMQSIDCLKPRGMMALFGQSSGPVKPVDPCCCRTKGRCFSPGRRSATTLRPMKSSGAPAMCWAGFSIRNWIC